MHQSAFCFYKKPTKHALELRRKAQERQKPIIIRKHPNPIGKSAIRYSEWRDQVAKPYLDNIYGHYCVDCGTQDNLDVAHILGRGSHPRLKMVVSNVHWKCRACHQKESGIVW